MNFEIIIGGTSITTTIETYEEALAAFAFATRNLPRSAPAYTTATTATTATPKSFQILTFDMLPEHKLQAVKTVRNNVPGMMLGDAKRNVEAGRVDCGSPEIAAHLAHLLQGLVDDIQFEYR